MKKLISTILMALFSVIGFAQPFILAVDGFRDSKDTMKDYIVVTVPDCDKTTLFQRAKNYFTVIYNSPQNVMSESGSDAISIMGGEEISYSTGGMGRSTCRFSYKLICEFRDGRVRIAPVWIDLYGVGHSFPLQSPGGLSVVGVYRKNGELRDDKAKAQIEAIINSLVSGLEKALTETTAPASEDW